ncbi:MAG: RsbRD N-terminal domain-containing protein [Desulfosporosinus sp.]|nr:RsbRD N-terminal domain-containing protein [Desulfosporosinus sp.]
MDTKLKDLIEEKRSVILERWFDAIVETYPLDTTGFFKKQKDRFANPVGHAIVQGTEGILEVLISGKELNEDLPFLNDFIKVRAVQDFTPAKAMDFIFLLKKVVREVLEKEIRQNQIYDALLSFESKIDDLALFAFDIYVKCREQIYELKTDELKRMTYTLLKKANLMYEIPAEEFEVNDQKCNT